MCWLSLIHKVHNNVKLFNNIINVSKKGTRVSMPTNLPIGDHRENNSRLKNEYVGKGFQFIKKDSEMFESCFYFLFYLVNTYLYFYLVTDCRWIIMEYGEKAKGNVFIFLLLLLYPFALLFLLLYKIYKCCFSLGYVYFQFL